jgi:23S rRNA (cytidine1920-2'-O)/16S rRNA (cytidine1409-2'-O)-methyltransferase
MRLDHFLVRNKNIESRTKAQDLIQSGAVLVNGKLIFKSSFAISESDHIEIINTEVLKYVSRAGIKLEAAIKFLNLDFNQKKVLDIGQSTGGFTDCALQLNANLVFGIDVGEGQLHEKIKKNSRVTFFEKLNVKNIAQNQLFINNMPPEGFDIVVCDVSFISLQHVVPHIFKYLKKNGQYLFLVKPQFECGPENLDKNGLVKNEKVYTQIQFEMIELFTSYFGEVISYFESALRGKEGNLEFFIYGRHIK